MYTKVFLVGNLATTPETRKLPDGISVTNLRIGTHYRRKDGTDETEYHSVVAFDKSSVEHYKTGDLVFVEGRIRTRKWQDKDGQDRYTTEVIAERTRVLSRKKGETSMDTGATTTSAEKVVACDDVPF